MLKISDNDNMGVPLVFRNFTMLGIPDNDIYNMVVPLAFRDFIMLEIPDNDIQYGSPLGIQKCNVILLEFRISTTFEVTNIILNFLNFKPPQHIQVLLQSWGFQFLIRDNIQGVRKFSRQEFSEFLKGRAYFYFLRRILDRNSTCQRF